MNGEDRRDPPPADRRAFLGHLTAGALTATAVALPAGLPAPLAAQPLAAPEGSAVLPPWSDAWLDRIKGKHRQFFDAATPNDGHALLFAMNFLNQYNEAYGIPDRDLTTIVGIRHFAACMAVPDRIWAKYRLGEFFKIIDHKTRQPATRNVFLYDEAMVMPGGTIPKLQARGVIFTVCNTALAVASQFAAEAVSTSKEGAAHEWASAVLPDITRVPMGTIAANRAQEKGCTYCYGG